MKKKIILLLITIIVSGCRYYSYISDGTAAAYHPTKIDLDNGYELYVRQVGKPKSPYSVLRRNYEQLDPADREKIEIQYLLFSPVSKRVIYLTTIPPFYTGDKNHKWIYDEQVFDDANFVNLWFLNLFFIGTYDAPRQKFLFNRKDATITDEWDFSLTEAGRVLTIDRVTDNKPQELQDTAIGAPDDLLSLPLRFYRQNNFQMGLSGHWHERKLKNGITLHDGYRAIYFANEGKKTSILFNIGRDSSEVTPERPLSSLPDDWMLFKDIRVRYKP
jgi:hypothetical protein